MKFHKYIKKTEPKVNDIWMARYSYNSSVRFYLKVVRVRILDLNNVSSYFPDYPIKCNVLYNGIPRTNIYSFRREELIRRVG